MLGSDYGNMATNVGYFYFAVEIVLLILIFILLPEIGHLSLEQIDDYHELGVPAWKTSLIKNKRAQGSQYLREDQSDATKASS